MNTSNWLVQQKPDENIKHCAYSKIYIGALIEC